MNKESSNHSTSLDHQVIDEELAIEDYLKQYKVIIHNDDYTSMEFVIKILIDFFDKSYQQAYKIMLLVHHKGSGIAGIYSKEIAETKIKQVKMIAEENEFPLNLTMEKVK